jgi:predicted nucleic acid-binding protein
MEKHIIYPDSSLILNVFWEDERGKRARSILDDPLRLFVVSDYLWLETLPKMLYNKQNLQAKYADALFRRSKFVPASDAIIAQAKEFTAVYGLAGMDALHVACAIAGGVDELVTFEKPTKPFFRVPPEILRITSLYDTPSLALQ